MATPLLAPTAASLRPLHRRQSLHPLSSLAASTLHGQRDPWQCPSSPPQMCSDLRSKLGYSTRIGLRSSVGAAELNSRGPYAGRWDAIFQPGYRSRVLVPANNYLFVSPQSTLSHRPRHVPAITPRPVSLPPCRQPNPVVLRRRALTYRIQYVRHNTNFDLPSAASQPIV